MHSISLNNLANQIRQGARDVRYNDCQMKKIQSFHCRNQSYYVLSARCRHHLTGCAQPIASFSNSTLPVGYHCECC